MSSRHLLIASTAALLALGACADTTDTTPAGSDLSATDIAATDTASVDAPSPDRLLDYETFTLDNGLEVILARDTSDPIVAMMTVAHVGSSREKPGRTGFAHFFEHMAFNDSENVPQGANRRDIPAWGGARNGYTTRDRTVYYETVPKDAFDKLLWIDSDRLGYMINTVTTAALEREKQVVKNEKRQRVDNAPYGYAREIIPAALYPGDHPYNWPVIGSLPDLQAATLDDVREFYDTYYGPNNATLAIVGDIDIAETKAKVDRWFGEIPRGIDVPKPEPRPVSLDADRRLMFEDNFAKLPQLQLVYPTPPQFADDETALNALATYLGQSKSSPLYKRIVEEEALAPGVTVYHWAQELAGEFHVVVRANDGVDLDRVAAAVDAAMAEFAANGIAPSDLERIKSEQETILYNELATVRGKAESLAVNAVFAGDPAYAEKQADAVRALTPEAVEAAFATHIADRPRILLSMVPAGQTDLAVEGSDMAEVWIEDVTPAKASEAVSQGEAAQYTRTETRADRSEPAFGELPLSRTVPIYEADLAPGVLLTGTEFSEAPLVEFDITFDTGARDDADDALGATALLSRVLEEGSATRTAAEIEQALGLLGAGMSVGTSQDEIAVYGTTLARNLPDVVAIIDEVLTRPRFTDAVLSTARDAQLSSIRNRQANPSAVATRVLDGLLYGDHPEGRPTSGTLDSVAALDLDTLRESHARLGGAGVRIHVAGDVSEADAIAAFDGLAQRLANSATLTLPDAPGTQPIGGNVYFIDVPGSKQSVIRAGRLTVASTDPAHERIQFANQKLGGSIAGDLAQTLRIEKGYTYGAYSGVANGRVAQPWGVRTSVRANATLPSLEIIRDMLASYGRQFGDGEAELSRNQIIKDAARSQESLGAKRTLLTRKSKYGLGPKLVEDRQERLLSMSTQDFRDVATRWFAPSQMAWVVVGDGETQREAVRNFADTLPGEFIELDVDGNPI